MIRIGLNRENIALVKNFYSPAGRAAARGAKGAARVGKRAAISTGQATSRAASGVGRGVSRVAGARKTLATAGIVGTGLISPPIVAGAAVGVGALKGGSALRRGMKATAKKTSSGYTKAFGESGGRIHRAGAFASRHPFLTAGTIGAMAHGGSRRQDRRWANGRSVGRTRGHSMYAASGVQGLMPRGTGGFA